MLRVKASFQSATTATTAAAACRNRSNVDANGSSIVPVGYLGIPDALNAAVASSGGGDAVYLKFNGVYESDSAIENGLYDYWGYEHILGAHGQAAGSTQGLTAAAIKAGLASWMTATSAGTAANDISTTVQSGLLPLSLMNVERGASQNVDSGTPSQK